MLVLSGLKKVTRPPGISYKAGEEGEKKSNLDLWYHSLNSFKKEFFPKAFK
jgi:hypothetical protein